MTMSNPYEDLSDDRFPDDRKRDEWDRDDRFSDDDPPMMEVEYESASDKPRNIRWGCWIFSILGVGMLMCCGLCGGLILFGIQLMNQEVESELADNPAIIENIGEIQTLETQWLESAENSGESDETIFVYRVQGTKGSGKVYVKIREGDFEEGTSIESGLLELDGGGVFELDPDNPFEQ